MEESAVSESSGHNHRTDNYGKGGFVRNLPRDSEEEAASSL